MEDDAHEFAATCPTCGGHLLACLNDHVAGCTCPHCQVRIGPGGLRFTGDAKPSSLVTINTTISGQPRSDVSHNTVRDEKAKIYRVLAISAGIALLIVLANPPKETGWWIFKSVSTPFQYLFGTAFLLAVGYLFLVVRWYQGKELCARTTILAFALSGTLSIIFSLSAYPIVGAFGLRERVVQTGFWIFTTTERIAEYENGLLGLIHQTGAIAGLVEEPAKLAALLCIPSVRNAITNRQSGLYYATLCAFGFAFIENITYFQSFDAVLYFRANPAHAVFTSLWGAALGSWREGAIGIGEFLKYLLLGIGLHALWNVLASADLTLFLVAFCLTIWLGMSFIRRELRGQGTL